MFLAVRVDTLLMTVLDSERLANSILKDCGGVLHKTDGGQIEVDLYFIKIMNEQTFNVG